MTTSLSHERIAHFNREGWLAPLPPAYAAMRQAWGAYQDGEVKQAVDAA